MVLTTGAHGTTAWLVVPPVWDQTDSAALHDRPALYVCGSTVVVMTWLNALALSVFECTREIGLLRAIGLRRQQLSGMITIEAVATAVFGAVLGTALGLGLGIALQRGLTSQGLKVLAISWPTIIIMLVVSAIVGVLAAVLPSIRAVRLNILTAIAADG